MIVRCGLRYVARATRPVVVRSVGHVVHGRVDAANKGSAIDVRRVDRLPLDETAKHNLFGMGITTLFNIQARAFDPILRGRNFVGRSRTGTGKTVAYLLPVLERMRHEKMTSPHAVLILVPSPELCKQVGGTILTLSVTANIALVYGGPSLASQEQMVRLGANVVVSTPGRCARLLTRGAIQAQNVRILVVDEADAMLGLDFLGRVERVLTAVSKQGLQCILFSASLPGDLEEVIRKHFHECERVDLVDVARSRGTTTVGGVTHRLCKVPQERNSRIRILLHFLVTKLDELGGQCIIFVDSLLEARALLQHPMLDRKSRSIHMESSSEESDVVLTSFANKEFDVLVATDVVARGVDFKDVSLVLQFHPPREATQYIHRAGRTGRAGQQGMCLTLYDQTEARFVHKVREVTKQKFQMESAPGNHDIHYAAVSRLLDDLLSIQEEEYAPVLAEAEKLITEQGTHAFAVAMAVLDGRHASLDRAVRTAPSLLTGRKGYVCVLVADPDHMADMTEGELRRTVISILPRKAGETSVGRIVRTDEGWAVDIAHQWSSFLIHELRSGRQSAPFEMSVAHRMPRLARVSSLRARRMPWESMRKRAVLQRRRLKAPEGRRHTQSGG